VIRRSRLARVAAMIFIIAAMGLAATGVRLTGQRLNDIRVDAHNNALWSASRLEIELLRFQRNLADFGQDGRNVTAVDINRRFDILWSRLAEWNHGAVGDRLRGYDQDLGAVTALSEAMKEYDPIIVALTDQDVETVRRLQRLFAPYGTGLRALSNRVLLQEEAIAAARRASLAQSANAMPWLSGIALVASLVMIALFWWESEQFRKLAATNRRLLEISDNVSRAKSQFLAMMSHELRTPLNGVLGLLSLIREGGLQRRQDKLLEQAARSGEQMTRLLEDMLDFRALQDGQVTPDLKPFSPSALLSAIQALYAPVALAHSTGITIRISDSCPPMVLGDYARLRQALTHLVGHLIEAADSDRISLDAGGGDARLWVEIAWEQPTGEAIWLTRALKSEEEDSTGDFAAEALGPAMALALIKGLGGTVTRGASTSGRLSMVVEFPAPEVTADRRSILVDCASQSLQAICAASLKGGGIRVLEGGAPDTCPDAVLAEIAGRPGIVSSLRQRFPNARIIGLGGGPERRLCDAHVTMPVDVAQLQRICLDAGKAEDGLQGLLA